ncbi:hypothetical protein [Streptomyces griseoviridis]|uniref:hypothetical protein n=1 Tax=Streptomyces griseoviridis TaxID=45398 RepID=UPI001673979A|nr:hypothetical protein [Streptomyces niveoruber]
MRIASARESAGPSFTRKPLAPDHLSSLVEVSSVGSRQVEHGVHTAAAPVSRPRVQSAAHRGDPLTHAHQTVTGAGRDRRALPW